LSLIAINPKFKKIAYFIFPNYVGAALSLITFPIIAAKLGVEQFGKLELFLVFGVLLNYGFHFGWSSAHNRFYLEPEIKRSNLIWTLFVSRLWILLVVIILVFAFQSSLLEWFALEPQHMFLIWVAVGIFICKDFSQFHLQRYRMLNQPTNYMFMALSTALIYPTVLLSSMILLEPTPALVLVCTLISVSFPLVGAWILDHKWFAGGAFDWAIFGRVMHFGLPLVPAGLTVMAIQAADRAMLRSLITDPEWSLILLGYYAFALRLVSIYKMATNGFNIVWAPYYLRTYQQNDAPLRYKYIFSSYLLVLAIISFGIVLMGHFLVPIFLNQYSPSLPILSILLASAMLYSVGDYFCIGIDIKHKNWIRALSGVIALAVNLILNFYFIPSYGALGAALATFVSTAFYGVPLMVFSHRFYPVSYSFVAFLMLVLALLLSSTINYSQIFVVMTISVSLAFLSIFILSRDVLRAYKLFFVK